VISISNDEITRTNDNVNNSDDSSCNSNDYSEKKNVNITIPDWREIKNNNGEKYIVFNVHMCGRFLCSRRYKEFDAFNTILKNEFGDFNFPNLPSKWPFKLNEQQLETRKNALEHYLDKSILLIILYKKLKN
jgi:sorting nexin-27